MDAAFDERLGSAAAAFEAVLEQLLSGGGPDKWPPRLTEAMRYAVLGGGKRLRPFILIATARLFGVCRDDAGRAAAALELVHCYSLVHDDLPAMDDDDLRRGRPTVHRQFDEATAILVGDSLLTLAFEILADPQTHSDAEIRSELALGLARAAGAGGMAGGQALDLGAEGRQLDAEAIAALQAMKTGALFCYAAEAGAIIGEASAEQRAACARFGTALGAAFQLADDLLDHIGAAATLGKTTGRDAELKKSTLVALWGEERARAELAARIAEAEAALSGFDDRADTLRAAARFVGDRAAIDASGRSGNPDPRAAK